MRALKVGIFFSVVLGLALGCSDSSSTSGSSGSTDTDGGTTTTDGSTATSDASVPVECATAATNIEKVVCTANAFNALLTDAEKTTVNLAFTDAVAKTRWSNLPGQTRSGIKFGALTAEKVAAAYGVAKVALSDAGYQDFLGILAADDFLGAQGGGGGGPGGGSYAAANYSIAFIGTPSTTGNWMLQIGGHHLAFNITYLAGVGHPTPNHQGVEPKASFTINGQTYEPLTAEATAFQSVFTSLDAAALGNAYLSGQSFPDVLLGPVEYAKGTYATSSFPTGANRKGVLVSSLTTEQQALVKTALEGWVRDYDPAVADPIIADYTSAAALADTYIAWGGTQASGVDLDVNGTYMRIDGPRAWIEVSCQNGVVISGKTHFHTIYRDKVKDYGAAL